MPPNLPLTSANICKIIRASPTPPVQHFAVPYVLKLLGETEEGVQTLADFEAVSFAGAAVPVSKTRRYNGFTLTVRMISVTDWSKLESILSRSTVPLVSRSRSPDPVPS